MSNYFIDENNAVTIKQDNSGASLFQPHHPDGTPFADVAEAEAWVTKYLADAAEWAANHPVEEPTE